MDFTGFNDMNFGRKSKKSHSTRNKYCLIGFIIIYIIFVIVSISIILRKSSGITKYTSDIQELDLEVDTTQGDISSYRSEIAKLEEDKVKLNKEKLDLTAKNVELSEKFNKISPEHDKILQETEALEEKMSSFDKELNELQKSKAKLTKSLDGYKYDRNSYEKEKNKYASEIANLRIKLKDYESGQGERIREDEPIVEATSIDSAIIKEKKELKFLNGLFDKPPKEYKLLYRMSINGRNEDNFLKAIRGRDAEKHIFLFKSKEGSIFGGYLNNVLYEGYISDHDAFIFNVNNKVVYPQRTPDNIFYTGGKYIAVFGEGDIVFSEDGFLSEFPNKFGEKDDKKYELTDGKQYCDIVEFELFQVI